jgi:transposase
MTTAKEVQTARHCRHIHPSIRPDLKTKNQQLIAQGKPAKIAITAVMRKLIVIASTLLKANRLWVKSLA